MARFSNNIAQNSEGLPIEKLVTAPIISAAKTQQELSSVYIDDLIYWAYPDETNKEINRK